MRKYLIVFAAMLALQACDKPQSPKPVATKTQTVDSRGSHFPATYGHQFSPGNMWDELLLKEEALAKAQPGLFTRNQETLTIFRDGKPFAEFKEASTDDDSAIWRIAGTVELYDAGTNGTMTAYRLIRGGIEYSEEVLLDPEGRLYAMGEDIEISPNRHLIAAGALNDWSPSFAIIDWSARKVYAFDIWCQTLTWDSDRRAKVACAGTEGISPSQAATIEPSGKTWKFQTTGYYEMAGSDSESDIISGKVPLRSGENVPPIMAKVAPLKDNTESFSKLGYRFLGSN